MKNGETASTLLIYQSEDGKTKIETKLEDETVWLMQEQMSELFQKSRSTINEHIKHIYQENELEETQTMSKFGNSEFTTKPTNFYNLDVIISVGYHVKSLQGTKFRQWATARLKEFIVKGFTMNDELILLNRIERLDDFLKMTGKDILKHTGKISHDEALKKATQEYKIYKEKLKTQLSSIEKDFIDHIESSTKCIKELK